MGPPWFGQFSTGHVAAPNQAYYVPSMCLWRYFVTIFFIKEVLPTNLKERTTKPLALLF